MESLIEKDARLAKEKEEKLIAEKKQILEEQKETQEGAKKLDANRELKYNHPLMTCEMNLLEISHRVVEKVEKAKYRIVANSTGSLDKDIEKFKAVLIDELVKFN